jgi:pimeloyl-ACP methyl ester carboxylesterase
MSSSKIPINKTLIDLSGWARLAVDGVLAASHQAEDLQLRVSKPLPFAVGDHITRGVYRSVRAIATLIGNTAALAQRLGNKEAKQAHSYASEAPGKRNLRLLAILNGVCGDHLRSAKNPLAIAMQWCTLDAGASKTVLPARYAVFVHGLCLDERCWLGDTEQSHVQMTKALGYTPLFLRYNSGASLAENGAEFAAKLAGLDHPIAVVIAHSMGGLVTRIALEQLHAKRSPLLQQLKAVIYLGTPHAGAPLEQGGYAIERLWTALPYAGALAPLARMRSQGIQYLRAGLKESKRRKRGYVEYAIAASLSTNSQGKIARLLQQHLIGDGLVAVQSALGIDALPAGRIPETRQRVLYGLGHLDLLHAPAVTELMQSWLVGASASD